MYHGLPPRFSVTRSQFSAPSPRPTCSVRINLQNICAYCLHTHIKPSHPNTRAAATIDYLDSGKVKTKGIVNKTFKLEQFGEALESIKNKSAIKAAIVFDDATGV